MFKVRCSCRLLENKQSQQGILDIFVGFHIQHTNIVVEQTWRRIESSTIKPKAAMATASGTEAAYFSVFDLICSRREAYGLFHVVILFDAWFKSLSHLLNVLVPRPWHHWIQPVIKKWEKLNFKVSGEHWFNFNWLFLKRIFFSLTQKPEWDRNSASIELDSNVHLSTLIYKHCVTVKMLFFKVTKPHLLMK